MSIKRMKADVSGAALVLAASLFTGHAAKADDAPQGVTLNGFAYAGSGCPAGSVVGNLPVEGNSFDIAWTAFTAEVGPQVPLSSKRKNCQVNLDLGVPAGWQYAVESIEYLGEVDLETNVVATASSAYYFQGDATTARFNTSFEGPDDRSFQIIDVVPARGQKWSSCGGGRSLNINYSVRLDNSQDSQARGSVSFGESGGTAFTHIALTWRPCI